MGRRLRVGVIGCGLITQVQHLPNLLALPELFNVVAVADIDNKRASNCAERFGVPGTYGNAEEMLAGKLDAVVIATSGDHSDLVLTAVASGASVLVEKPLCLDLASAMALASRLGTAGKAVMLGYMRRYDEAFCRLQAAIEPIGPLTVVRARTVETAASAYLRDRAIDEDLKVDEDPSRANGDNYSLLENRTGGSSRQARLYKNIVLDSLVHELNMVQALAGPVQSVAFAELSEHGASAVARCQQATAQLAWVATPGAARYVQELQLLGAAGSATVRFGSPYLPGAAGVLIEEGGGPDLGGTWHKETGPAPVGPFHRELLAFYRHATGEEPAPTTLAEGIADIAACEALGRAAVTGHEVKVENIVPGKEHQ